jgi:L-ascorbate metabolism protein UlaG (beta-lactamase superfamily)
MEITWLGHSCFRLRSREAVVITDPCPPTAGYSIGRVTADIVTISHDHPSHNYRKAVAGTPIVITAPGEYEIAGVFIAGIATHHGGQKDSPRGKNTAYMIEMDNIRLCHLGDVGHVPMPEQVDDMSGADVLLIPVGGKNTIDAATAAEVVGLLEPAVVIPMHYKTAHSTAPLDPLQRFLTEMGLTQVEPLPKVSFNRSNLPDETQVIVLDYKR